MIEYLYLGFLLVSMLLIFFAYQQYNSTRLLIDNGIRTTATVIDLLEVRSDDGYSYMPVFEFTDKNYKKITFEGDYSSNPAPHKVGEKVKIIYSKNTEERKIVSFWGLYRWSIILLCIASPLLIIGGSYFLYTRT